MNALILFLLVVIIIQLAVIHSKLPKRDYNKEAVDAAIKRDQLLREAAEKTAKK